MESECATAAAHIKEPTMPAEQGMHQDVFGLSKKDKSKRADERKPLGHKSLPHFCPKLLSAFTTESEDSAVLLPQFCSSSLQFLRRVREITFKTSDEFGTAYACWFLFST